MSNGIGTPRSGIGPDDIELGDEAIQVERRPRSGVVVSVRLSADEADRLQDIAEGMQTTLPRVAREAILQYVAARGQTPQQQGIRAER